jgi:signal transduction histidine kinase
VFINLIINATHSIKGSGRITILAEQDANAGEVRIEVRDTGHGIPEEIQGQLFDPFYTTKEEGKGTGLGLSVAYGIIQQHHGNITVHSTPGEGASFFIHLPMELTNNNGPA